MNPCDLAYFAGIIDVHGSLTIDPVGKSRRPRVEFRNQDRTPLDVLSSAFGGKVGEYRKGNTHFFYWQRTYGSARRIVEQVRPYMRIRTDIADRILRWRPAPRGLPSYRPVAKPWNLEGITLTKAGRGFGRRA